MNMMQRFDKTFEAMGENFPETMEIIKDFYAKEFLSLRERVEGLKTDKEWHICRFNDGEQTCECLTDVIDAVLRILDDI